MIIFLTSLPVKNTLSSRVRFAVFTKLRHCETKFLLAGNLQQAYGGSIKQIADGYIFTNFLENKLASNLEDIPLSPHPPTHPPQTHTHTHKHTHTIGRAANMLGHPPISLGVIKLVDVYPGLKGPF
jgi:hypothetical protein